MPPYDAPTMAASGPIRSAQRPSQDFGLVVRADRGEIRLTRRADRSSRRCRRGNRCRGCDSGACRARVPGPIISLHQPLLGADIGHDSACGNTAERGDDGRLGIADEAPGDADVFETSRRSAAAAAFPVAARLHASSRGRRGVSVMRASKGGACFAARQLGYGTHDSGTPYRLRPAGPDRVRSSQKPHGVPVEGGRCDLPPAAQAEAANTATHLSGVSSALRRGHPQELAPFRSG